MPRFSGGDKDPLTQARSSAAQRRQELLIAAGGGMSTSELAVALGVGRGVIDYRRRAGTLLAVPGPKGGWVFPRAQFNAEIKPLDGLSEVLSACIIEDPWMILSELLALDEDLGHRSIFQVLRDAGEAALPVVMRAVCSVGDHGA